MNRERLKIARDYLANEVNPEKFDMNYFRNGDRAILQYKTVGNVIGHLTALDDKFKTDPDYFRNNWGRIMFDWWGIRYYGLTLLEYKFITSYIFAIAFHDYTNKQQLAHTVERIDYMRKYGRVPKGFKTFDDCIKFPLGFSKYKRNEQENNTSDLKKAELEKNQQK